MSYAASVSPAGVNAPKIEKTYGEAFVIDFDDRDDLRDRWVEISDGWYAYDEDADLPAYSFGYREEVWDDVPSNMRPAYVIAHQLIFKGCQFFTGDRIKDLIVEYDWTLDEIEETDAVAAVDRLLSVHADSNAFLDVLDEMRAAGHIDLIQKIPAYIDDCEADGADMNSFRARIDLLEMDMREVFDGGHPHDVYV